MATYIAADTIITRDGVVYERARVMHANPDSLTIMHSAGIVTVPFSDLPDDLQEQYGYDPERLREQRRQAAMRRVLDEKSYDVIATLTQVLPDGALAQITEIKTTVTERHHPAVVETVRTPPRTATHRRIDGSTYEVQTAPGSSRQVVRRQAYTSIHTNRFHTKWDQTAFLTGIPHGYVDGDTWRGKIWFSGTYDYTSVMGASRRVRKYTADVREARIRLGLE